MKLNEETLNRYLDNLEFAARFRLISNERFCPSCDNKMSLKKKSKKFLKHIWYCNSLRCKKELSVADISYFYGTNLEFDKTIRILYKFSQEIRYNIISYDLDISEKAIGNWANIIINASFYEFHIQGNKIGY